MKIKGFLAKSGLALAFAAALAGCGPSAIGPKAETPDLKGETTLTEVFNGGPQQYLTRIEASALQEKGSYTADGRLEIEGNIPSHVSITVRDGELLVNGNVGDDVKLHVTQPIQTHNENYPDFCYGYDFMAGSFKYSFKLLRTSLYGIYSFLAMVLLVVLPSSQ